MKPYPFDKYGSSQIRVIADTDCACEGDDAFAIAHILITSKFDVRAIMAANFLHLLDSVQRSYEAIQALVDAMELSGSVNILKGSLPMDSEEEFQVSEASRFIVEEALREDERPLFVVCQGAITNLAIALRMCPAIAERIQCIWIGGAPYPAGGREFNLSNDVVAARVVMESRMPLWQVPQNVYSMMRVSFMTLYQRLYPCGQPGKYLCEQLWDFQKKMQDMYAGGKNAFGNAAEDGKGQLNKSKPENFAGFATGEMWVLGDSPVVGLMLNAQVHDRDIIGAPYINEDGSYTLRPENERKIAVYKSIDSQFILEDFFAKMEYQYKKATKAEE